MWAAGSTRRLIAILVTAAVLSQHASGAGKAVEPVAAADLDQLEIEVIRAEDASAIRKLQRAYGHYADRGAWDDLADLFTDDAAANYPSGGFDGNASIRAMFVQNLGQGRNGLAEGRLYNHIILQPVVDLAPDGATATGRWRVLGMLGRFGGSATWSDSLYRIDYAKRDGTWKISSLIAYAGSGGGHEQGWVAPRPRPPGTPDTSPVRFNLAHPADRPWIDACEQDVSACVVPFPYPNRGTLQSPARVGAVFGARPASSDADRAAQLARRAQRLAGEQAVLNLQRIYGYYIDRGLWQQAAQLFAPDGSREVGQAGVYVGRDRIRQSMSLTRPRGLRAGELHDHLQLEPVINVAPDGRHAQGRVLELAFTGGGGEPARIVQSIAENDYVQRDGVWMIQSMHVYTILATDYDSGWGKSALPASVASRLLPPDRPPSRVYETYPKFFNPPPRFVVRPGAMPGEPDGIARSNDTAEHRLEGGGRLAQRVLDYNEIENLQNAYGYYAEKSLWSEMAALFVNDGELLIDRTRHAGVGKILAYWQSAGPEGPVKGRLDSQLHVQPVIHVAADGRSARIRSRMLQLSRDAQGRPRWGSGLFENEVVKDNGVWKFKRVHLYRMYEVDYDRGWATPRNGQGELFPSRFTPPFHYRHPVTGR
jgi:hypothetical protein